MKIKLKKDFWYMSSSKVPANRFIISAYLACYFVTVLPILYFLYKNYLFMDEIGYKFFPTLLEINNQDKLTLLILIVFSFFSGLGLQVYAHHRFLKKIYEPIDDLQAHMSGLIEGQFDQPKLSLKQDQYVQELLKTYNYLYGSLQKNLKRDITFLNELKNIEDHQLAKVLVNEKTEQLNLDSDSKHQKPKFKFLKSI